MLLKTRNVHWKAAALVLAAAMMTGLSAPRAFAQQVAVAGVDGTVTDTTGAAVAGAQVRMIDIGTDQPHAATTDTSGRYELPNLPIGSYRLEVKLAGFKTYVQNGIILQVGSNVTQNVKLEIGDVSQSIEVTGNAAMVETKENAISQVIESQKIVDLPLNGRNPTQLLQLTGGGTNTAPAGNDLTGSKNMGGSNASGTFSVAGSQANGLNYLLDGGDNNDAFSNVNLPIPFPDAIEEFNVMANGLPAQYGLHPGGTVNIVTKSGANAFHGDAFEFLRNGDFNARQEGTLTRDTLKRSQYGGTAGGRIIKDKLFYFGGYQGTRQRSIPRPRSPMFRPLPLCRAISQLSTLLRARVVACPRSATSRMPLARPIRATRFPSPPSMPRASSLPAPISQLQPTPAVSTITVTSPTTPTISTSAASTITSAASSRYSPVTTSTISLASPCSTALTP